MKIIDISGSIYNGMWTYGPAYPEFKLTTIGFPYGGEVFPVDVFEGFHAQVGTYIESPSIFIKEGIDKLNDIPPQNFFKVNTYVLQVPLETLAISDGRPFITAEDIKKAETGKIQKGSVILISTGYGRKWTEKDYIEKSWFFKKDALYYLIEKRPYILGGDSPVWENDKKPEGAFERFYKEGILLLAPCINLEKINKFKVKSIILPLKISEASVCPVRAVVIEE